jgi:1,4-alpha-glucan branching enzyme
MFKKLTYILISISLFACESVQREEPKEAAKPVYTHHSDWSKSAVIYELNIRQFSEKGDFNSVIPHLDRLKAMGIDIIWLMPVHPIGEENRKGGLGSYYSVKDYTDVNPNYGTMDDFKKLVDEIHNRDMFVIIDWVANHSAWDNPWTEEHPDWYTLDSTGNMIPPVGTDWSDVVDLNYDNRELRRGMIDAMKFWVQECGIDGFRCDVADWVPVDFWKEARLALDSTDDDLFMLAEAENPKHHPEAFDMSYGWELHHISNEIAKGKMNFDSLHHYMLKEDTNFHESAYRMNFTSNHDENSWNGTVFERYGDNYLNWAVLTSTIDGMPLVYSGQESKMNKRLRFFEKDTIEWADYPLEDFYKNLFTLKDSNEALWNGHYGGPYERIVNSDPENVFSFTRQKGENVVLVVLNNNSEKAEVNLQNIPSGEYREFSTTESINLTENTKMVIPAHSYRIFYK